MFSLNQLWKPKDSSVPSCSVARCHIEVHMTEVVSPGRWKGEKGSGSSSLWPLSRPVKCSNEQTRRCWSSDASRLQVGGRELVNSRLCLCLRSQLRSRHHQSRISHTKLWSVICKPRAAPRRGRRFMALKSICSATILGFRLRRHSSGAVDPTNFNTVSSASFYRSFSPCDARAYLALRLHSSWRAHWFPLLEESRFLGGAVSRQELHMADGTSVRWENTVSFTLTNRLCPPPTLPPQMKMDRSVSFSKVAVGRTAPGGSILTEVTMHVCPAWPIVNSAQMAACAPNVGNTTNSKMECAKLRPVP